MREHLANAIGASTPPEEHAVMLHIADVALPKLVDPLASRLHQYEHADHLDSTGCWLGHRMKARFLLGMLDAPTPPEGERG